MIARLRISAAASVVLALVLVAAGEQRAGATTFCVPTFHPACPNSGGNVATPNLEQAMIEDGSDGVADTVVVAVGSFADPATFEPSGSDPLTVVGAGRAATTLTSGGSANIYVIALGARKVTMRDLTVTVPASFPNGSGAGIQMFGDLLERVDVVSLNPESNAIAAGGAGNVFRNGEVRGGEAGSVRFGIGASGSTAALLVEDATVRGSSWALLSDTGATLTARRISALGTRVYGVSASSGNIVLENSVLTIDDGIGLHASAAAENATISADHVTVVNSGGSDPALEGKKFSGTAGDITVNVANSILWGFASGYKTETPFGPGIGVVNIEASYSNLRQTGTSAGGNADLATANIDADPMLLPDFSLPPGSSSIDAGNPAAGLASDFLGAPRPTDGNGDGLAIRDQGAFEYQRPVPPGGGGGDGGGGVADTTKPLVKNLKGPGKALADGKAKFRFRASEAGSKFVCKLDRRKAAPCRSPKSYSDLKPGRHGFKVWAIDPAGNKSLKPAKRGFRVPAV